MSRLTASVAALHFSQLSRPLAGATAGTHTYVSAILIMPYSFYRVPLNSEWLLQLQRCTVLAAVLPSGGTLVPSAMHAASLLPAAWQAGCALGYV
jgi:hypothetical protein